MRNNKKIVIILSLIVLVVLIGISWLIVQSGNENRVKAEENKSKILVDAKEYIEKDDYSKAEDEINNILNNKKLFESLSKNEKFTVYNYLGIINVQQSKFLKAISNYEKADKFANKYNKLKSCINMAIAYRNIGEYIKSSEILINVSKTKVYNKEDNAVIKAYALLNLAEVYVNVGNYSEFDVILNKIDYFLKYVPSYYKEDLEIMYNTYLVIYDIHKNNVNEAKNKLNKINKLKKENKDITYTELEILELRANALYYKNIGDTKKALKNFKELEDASHNKGINDINLFALSQRIELYKKIGDKDNYNKLLQQYFYEQQEFEKINNSQYKYHLNNEFIKEINKSVNEYYIKTILIIFMVFAVILVVFINKIRKFEKKSLKDPLCDTYNRRFLDECVLKFKRRYLPVSIIMIDVDYFKLYNDNYGHQEGDLVLKSVANVLKNSCRKNDIVIRYGGEEFCILLNNTLKDEAIEIAKRINKNMIKERILHKYSNVENYITLSIGISTVYYIRHINEGIKLADKALYITKKNGRNGYNHIEDVMKKEFFK